MFCEDVNKSLALILFPFTLYKEGTPPSTVYGRSRHSLPTHISSQQPALVYIVNFLLLQFCNSHYGWVWQISV